MPRPMGIITIKADQRDALACENDSLSHVGCFSNKAAQDQVAKVAKTQGNSAPYKTLVCKPPTSSISRAFMGTTTQKGVAVASAFT
jgi:hypothetical protein